MRKDELVNERERMNKREIEKGWTREREREKQIETKANRRSKKRERKIEKKKKEKKLKERVMISKFWQPRVFIIFIAPLRKRSSFLAGNWILSSVAFLQDQLGPML